MFMLPQESGAQRKSSTNLNDLDYVTCQSSLPSRTQRVKQKRLSKVALFEKKERKDRYLNKFSANQTTHQLLGLGRARVNTNTKEQDNELAGHFQG